MPSEDRAGVRRESIWPAVVAVCLLSFASSSVCRGEGRPFLVRDINTAPGDGELSNLLSVNGILFFAAADTASGKELWRSDGTRFGTIRVKDLAPGRAGSDPAELTNVDGTVYFTADDGTAGRELWRSDGTSDGTFIVKDIFPGSEGSSPSGLVNLKGALFFVADDGTNGPELWRSDGTAPGTQLVKDIVPGSRGAFDEVFYFHPSPQLRAVGDEIFFVAD